MTASTGSGQALPASIGPETKNETLEAARAFLAGMEAPMALSVHLAEALAEILRLRRHLGFGAKAGYQRITLCGSRRFARAFEEWSRRLMLEESAMVYAAQVIPGLTPEQKERIDLLWFAQIEASDAIFVLNVGGYIGESTQDEIAFAAERGVKVRLLSAEYPGWTEADCRYAQAANPEDGDELLAALKMARECIAYCRRAHPDAQSGEGIPVETIIDAAIANATGQEG